jgi:hypothetical protein
MRLRLKLAIEEVDGAAERRRLLLEDGLTRTEEQRSVQHQQPKGVHANSRPCRRGDAFILVDVRVAVNRHVDDQIARAVLKLGALPVASVDSVRRAPP